ncbi:hypothetical protein PR202_ga05948 [Eleusine coracana subsp. coracana]|uniref:Reverse transcriptase zinc-binding domain-containing protein n=1 Tax=Eleusine coracana subsp. coracana TaxID=191504 RepID=A0AAV5BUU1_ELECO|nr:hypothetical protein PR202_ga05948 [Eleusine coracana subsp. coracana]
MTTVGDERSTLFWTDRWINGISIQELAPALMPFVKRRGWRARTVQDALTQNTWLRDIAGGLPVLATWQFLLLWDVLTTVELMPEERNAHVWTPCPSGIFSSKSAYERYFVGGISFEPHKRLWRTWAPLKIKIFVWLAIWRRCWTADRLERCGLPHPEVCPLCDQARESIDHILVSCVFVREVWFRVLGSVHLEAVAPTPDDTVFQFWWRASKRVTREQRKGFNTLVMLVVWETWKHRNRCVFDGLPPHSQQLLDDILQEAQLWALAGARKLRALL